MSMLRPQARVVAVGLLGLAIGSVLGHVAMLSPPSWSDPGGKTQLNNISSVRGWQWWLGNEGKVPPASFGGIIFHRSWYSTVTSRIADTCIFGGIIFPRSWYNNVTSRITDTCIFWGLISP